MTFKILLAHCKWYNLLLLTSSRPVSWLMVSNVIDLIRYDSQLSVCFLLAWTAQVRKDTLQNKNLGLLVCKKIVMWVLI